MNQLRKSKKVSPQSRYSQLEQNMVYVLPLRRKEPGASSQDVSETLVIDREADILVNFYKEPITSSHRFTPAEFAKRFPGIWEDVRDCYENEA
ncbi:MAG TPA: hypothetical protein VMW36_05405 [Patescibacteria group bacterium]|nr:hypothetical protein [Patescibacteria group bacterium]